MTTVMPQGLTECPRCGLPAKYLTADHLDRCGEAGNGFPAGRWRARDYLERSAAEQADMRRVEVAEVLKFGCPPVTPSPVHSRGHGTPHA